MAVPRPRHAAHDERTDQLGNRLGDVIARYVYAGGLHGPHDAALRVLADPVIADALAAADLVAALDREHQPIRWDDDSPTVVCACGSGAYDACPVRAHLDTLNPS